MSAAGMVNHDMPSQSRVAQSGDSVVSQLNIRQRQTEMSDEVGRLMQMEELEVRPQFSTEQDGFDIVDKFLHGDGEFGLTEYCNSNEDLPELAIDSVNELLSGYDSCISEHSAGEANMDDSVVQNKEQMMEEAVLSSSVSVDGIDKSRLYSPSPHHTSTQLSVATMHNPLSPTSVTGTMLQQLTIEHSNAPVEMAISGSGKTLPYYFFVPSQVCRCF